MADDLINITIDEWTSDTLALFNDLEKRHKGILQRGINSVISPQESPQVKAQFLNDLRTAQSIDEFQAALELRISQVGEEQAIKEWRQSVKL